MSLKICSGIVSLLFPLFFLAQQASRVEPPRTVDLFFDYRVGKPAFSQGQGPVVIIDEMHNNFHTSITTYIPFAGVLRSDGFQIKRGLQRLTRESLNSCCIYVIADAQPPQKKGDPPTFSEGEIKLINKWVKEGGSLFLITDHMPDPAPVQGLADSFGIKINNGYVMQGSYKDRQGPTVFTRAAGTLLKNTITSGMSALEQVTQVATFTGSAFKAGSNFVPILTFGKGMRSWMPKAYYKFNPKTPNIDVEGWYQGGVMVYGKGKVAFFSEAAMFTAQVFQRGKVKVGMNSPLARDNKQLLINVMHWLSELLSD